jgi:hypothetical protein
MAEQSQDYDESRIDFQQMLKDLESESVKPTLKDVKQTDIADLFKKKSGPTPDKKSQ